MKVSLERSAIVALVLSAFLATLAWAAPMIKPIRTPSDGAEHAALTAELVQLRGNEDIVLTQLRLQSAALAQVAWSLEARNALQEELAHTWRWDWHSHEQVVLQCLRPRFEDWADYVALVGKLGAKPGLIVESFELSAEGPPRARRFSAVTIGLRFVGTESSAPPSFRPDPPGPPAGITTKQNPQDKSQ